jgi:hypothetical protein
MTVFGGSPLTELRRALLIGCLALAGGPAQAGERDWLDSFQYQGFVAQGFTLSDDNNFYGPSSDGSFEFHEIGLNASLRPATNFQLAGQLLSRRAGETDDGDVRVDYLLADYSLVTRPRIQAGVRVGRIKTPLGLYNETRDVPFTRPSIFLPQSIYFDRTRALALSADGLQLYGDVDAAGGLLSLQLQAGKVQDEELDYVIFGFDPPGKFDGDLAYGGRLLYEDQQGLTLGLTYAHVELDYLPGTGDGFGAGTWTFRPLILSAQYDSAAWQVTAEVASRPLKLRRFGALLPDAHTTGQSGYLQGIYRFNDRWQALLRYDVTYADRDDHDGAAYAAATGRPAHSRFAKDWTVGLRWKPAPRWMVSTEFHHVDGTAWLAAQDNPQPTQRRWNLFAAQVSFRF